MSNSGDNTVSVISGALKTVTNTLTVGTNPYGVAFDSTNGNIYVANTDDNTVSVIITAAPPSTIPPILTVPADITTTATSVMGTVVTYTATATANQGIPTISCNPSSGSTFTVGTTTVSCTATDMYGNAATKSFNVIVQPMPDTIPPTFTIPPSDQVLFSMNPTGLVVSYTVAAIDNNGMPTVTCTPPSGSQFPIGTTTVTCTAKDAAGNTATATAHITINLQVNPLIPVLSHPTNVTAEATGPSGAVVTFTLKSTGGQGITPVTCTPPSGSQFPIGTTTVTCTAKDAAGNISLPIIFAVSVRDTTPPTIKMPPNIKAVSTGLLTQVNLGVPTVNDLVDPNPIIINNSPSQGFSVGSTQVIWTATDHSGNSATIIQIVTITPSNNNDNNSSQSGWSGEHHHKHRYNDDG